VSYVREQELNSEVDGKPVSLRLKAMKFSHLMQLAGYVGRVDTQKLASGGKLTQDDLELIENFAKVMPEYILEVKAHAADGSTVSKEEFCESAYFAFALLEIGTQWLAKAVPANPSSPGASPSG
jgi:hypothetical protein